jgi:hypothetical protein
MASYYINEARFAVPERAFVDRTIHLLEFGLPGGGAIGVIVGRLRMEEGQSLRDMVEKHVADDKKRLSGFTVLDETERTVGGAPAILLRSRWRNDGSALYQLQAHVAVDGTRMLFAVTGPLRERAACDETFDGLLESLVWRAG